MKSTIDDFLDQIYASHKRRWTGQSTICQDRRYYLPLPLLALCVANSSDATEILMLSYLLANATFRRDMFDEQNNGDDNANLEGAEYLAASIFFGMLLGGTLLGFLSDHIGRRPALLAGLLINATAGILSSFPFLTPTIAHLTMWRFVAGIGIGATVPSLFSLASEWSPKEVRGAVVTMVASFWMVGSLFVSITAWLLFSGSIDHDGGSIPVDTFYTWRIFAAVCALPSALGAWLVYFYVPESPRFLASAKEKYSQSAHSCNQMASLLGLKLISDANDDSIGGHTESNHLGIEATLLQQSEYNNNIQFDTIKPLAEEEVRRDYNSVLPAADTDIGSTTYSKILVQTLHTLIDTLQKLYSTQLLTRTTLPLQTIWFSLSFGTYGITTWINTLFAKVNLQNIYFNSFLFSLANLPGNIFSIMYSDRWGRKKMLVGSLTGAAGGLAVFALLVYSGNKNQSATSEVSNARTYEIVIAACLFQMFSIVSWNAIDILTGELFPTRVRSAGMGVCTACGRLGAMFAQFVNARLMMGGDDAPASVLVVAATTLLMGAFMPLFLERDMALDELKDEITEESPTKTVTLGCMAKYKGQKDHLSDDDEMEREFGLKSESILNEYQSFQKDDDSYLL